MVEPEAHARIAPVNSWLDGLLIAAVIALAALLGGAVVRNSQVWMHLATGRAIADGGFQFGADPFSHATEGRPWHHTAWLFDLLLYKLYSVGGDTAVVALRAAAVVVTAGLMLLVRRPGASFAWPAVGAAIALVAVNSRLPLFQSTFVSYLMLALLVWMLHSGGRWMPLGAGLLSVCWANLDSWFVLGPFTVALWLVGSWVHPIGTTPRRALVLALAASLIGSLINPFHARAFEIPDELAPTFYPAEVKQEPAMRSLLVGPFALSEGAGQWYSERMGAAPTAAFYALVAIGLASFAANFPAQPWGRLVVWLTFAVLASWRYRLVPFFAVASTPLVVLNLLDLGRHWPATAAGRTIGVLLRLFSVALLTLLGFAAFPGWLGPRADDPQKASRFGLRIEPDPAMERMARHIAVWEKEGRLTANDRGFSPTLEFASYLAWYGPSRQSFADSRWGLFAPEMADYLTMSKALNRLGRPGDAGPPADLRALDATMRRYGITYLVLDSVPTAQALWTYPKHWQFRGLAGRVTAFGHIDPERPRAGQTDWRLDPAALAFAPQDPPTHRPVHVDDLLIPSAWDAYRFGPPPVPLAQAESDVWAIFHVTSEALASMRRFESELALYTGLIGFGAAPHASLVVPSVWFNAASEIGRRSVSSDRMGAAVMSLRAARAAYFAEPRDSETLLYLARGYRAMPSTSRLQRVQAMTALKQAETRLPIYAAWGFSPMSVAYGIADMLSEYFFEGNQLDLYVAALKVVVQNLPYARLPAELARQKHASDTQKLREAEKLLQQHRDKYELEAEGRPPAERVAIALRHGLLGEALAVARAAADGRGVDPVDRINLMLETGHGEEAHEELRNIPLENVPDQRRMALRMLRLFAAAATSHNAEALEQIGDVLADYHAARDQLAKSSPDHIAQLTAQFFAVSPWQRAVTVPLMGGRLFALRRQADLRTGEFEMLLCRGLLSLQMGDTRLARQAFDDALKLSPRDAPLPGADLARLYLDLLVKYER